MKKYLKEIIILIIQLIVFYLLPLTAGPADTMGLIVLIILSTFILSLILGIISKENIKFLYPIIISILFIPTVFIYYNDTALIYILWYLVDSYIGLLIGSLIRLIFNKLKK
ncbi:MAG: hypothetical protein IK137_00930 [Bacilli bacterium]|nr:hypothetical protein [Bacilli bacterium]